MQTTSTTPGAAPSGSQTEPLLRLSERALTQLRQVMKDARSEGFCLSIRVVPSGCSGLGYDMNLVPEPRSGDLVWEQDGVRVATDPMSKAYLAGTEIDYESGLHSAGFKFKNPNAKSSCGCGSSFSA